MVHPDTTRKVSLYQRPKTYGDNQCVQIIITSGYWWMFSGQITYISQTLLYDKSTFSYIIIVYNKEQLVDVWELWYEYLHQYQVLRVSIHRFDLRELSLILAPNVKLIKIDDKYPIKVNIDTGISYYHQLIIKKIGDNITDCQVNIINKKIIHKLFISLEIKIHYNESFVEKVNIIYNKLNSICLDDLQSHDLITTQSVQLFDRSNIRKFINWIFGKNNSSRSYNKIMCSKLSLNKKLLKSIVVIPVKINHYNDDSILYVFCIADA